MNKYTCLKQSAPCPNVCPSYFFHRGLLRFMGRPNNFNNLSTDTQNALPTVHPPKTTAIQQSLWSLQKENELVASFPSDPSPNTYFYGLAFS